MSGQQGSVAGGRGRSEGLQERWWNLVKEDANEADEFVVACGGGIVLDKENIKIMKKTGIMICLCANCQEILKRVSSSTHRPILNVEKPKERIELLLKMRAPYYMQADKMIDTSKLSVRQVVAKITKILTAKK